MIKTLTSWRGIFALCIVCFHFAMHEFDQMAYAGVTFFFMLSGFLVTFHHKHIASAKQFYRRRMWRIFPLHWLALTLMIILDLAIMHKFHYQWDLPLHVVLLQSWVPSEQVFYNYSIHSWFLSSLLACVIFTPLLLKFLQLSSRRVAWTAIIVACAAVAAVNITGTDSLRSYLYVCPLARMVDYSLGMILGATMRERPSSKPYSTIRATVIEVATLAVFATFIAAHASGNAVVAQLENSAMWWIPMSLLLVSCTLLHGSEGLIGRLLSIKPLVWLGEISFEVYILQKLVNNAFCYLVAPFCGHYGILIYDYSFACTLPLLIVTAWAVHKAFNYLSHP